MRISRKIIHTAIAVILLAILPVNDIYSVSLENHKWGDKLTVALVLSGGGARGFAHIPIIEALEKYDIPIDMVIGTSMGALVGGLYAAGYSPKNMTELIEEYDMIELFSVSASADEQTEVSSFANYRDNIFNLSFDEKGLGSAPGIVGDQKILEMLNASLIKTSAITNFNHLPIPFRCVGTDLVNGEKIVFSNGSLVEAIRASISIPGFFAPAVIGDRMVVDGGLVDNLPIHLAREMGADIIIAVDVNAVDYDATAEDLTSLSSILGQLINIMTKNTVIDQIEDSDLLFLPLVEDYGILDFSSYKEIMEVGAESAREKEDEIEVLSNLICSMRQCNEINPERDGMYSYLPDIYIDKVYHTSVSPSIDGTSFPIGQFERYTSQFLDKEMIDQLHYQLEILREKDRYATISYAVKDITYTSTGQPHGNLEIISRDFEKRNLKMGLGIFGSTSIHYSLDDQFTFFFEPNLEFSFSVKELFVEPLSLSFLAVSEDAVKLHGELEYSFKPFFQLTAGGEYRSGNLLAVRANDPDLENSDSDYAFITSLYGQFSLKNEAKFHVGCIYDFTWYKEPLDDYLLVETPSVFLEGVYNTQNFTLFPHRGTRLDFYGELMLAQQLGYKGELRMKHSIELTRKDSLELAFRIGSTHSTTARASDYFSYGYTDGIVTTLSPLLVQDIIIASLSYYHWFTLNPVPLLLYSDISMGSRGDSVDVIYADDPYAVVTPPEINFYTPFDVTFSVGFGMTLSTIDLLVGYAVDLDLRSTIFVEVR